MANLWRHVAFSMLMFSAALRNVPPDVLEAAEIEGASAWRRVVSVTLPIMRPTIVTNLLLVTIANLSTFTLIYVMTQGGPGMDTATLAIYVYLQAFSFNQLGYGTAVALLLVLLGAAFSLSRCKRPASQRKARHRRPLSIRFSPWAACCAM
jgi:multiple sugar transport system permease protein